MGFSQQRKANKEFLLLFAERNCNGFRVFQGRKMFAALRIARVRGTMQDVMEKKNIGISIIFTDYVSIGGYYDPAYCKPIFWRSIL